MGKKQTNGRSRRNGKRTVLISKPIYLDPSLRPQKGNTFRFNVDRLVICYTTTKENLAALDKWLYDESEGFRLVPLQKKNRYFKGGYAVEIPCEEEGDSKGKWVVYGHLLYGMKLADKEASRPYVWFYLCNASLYTTLYPQRTIITYAQYISAVLGLEVHNLTSLDIALDSTVNLVNRLYRAIRQPHLVPIINRKRRTDPTLVLREVLYMFNGDQIRLRNKTIYVSQKKSRKGKASNVDEEWERNRALQLRCYEKSKETQQRQAKPYVAALMGTKKPLFRAEVKLGNEEIKAYLDKSEFAQYDCFSDYLIPDGQGGEHIDLNRIYNLLNNQTFLSLMYISFANRLIRFEDKERKGEKRNLFSIFFEPLRRGLTKAPADSKK